MIIGKLIRKIKYIFSYSKCYVEKEEEGHAKDLVCQGMVDGTKNTEYLSESCCSCPFYK